jgi:colanic acid/amylovoran biosynthesis protein
MSRPLVHMEIPQPRYPSFRSLCHKASVSGVALIPHVTWREDNDLVPLSRIYEVYKHSGRVVLVGGEYRAPQLKYLISRCRLFVGARTHATIAAYSTGVPTLALGYSVKARGIARDLFGDENALVIPVQGLESDRQLISAFEEFRERESELRVHLSAMMPAYNRRAAEAGAEVSRLVTS